MKDMTTRFIKNGFTNKQTIALSDAIRESHEQLVTKDHFDDELEKVRVEIAKFKVENGEKFNAFSDTISAKLGKQSDEILQLRRFFIGWLTGFAGTIAAASALISAIVLKFIEI